MKRDKKKSGPEIQPPPSKTKTKPKPEFPGIWEGRVRPLLEKRSFALALGLILLASIRIVATYDVFSLTGDESSHVACGLEYLAKHVYVYETQHPPLARAMDALLPYLAGTRPQGMKGHGPEGDAIVNSQGHPELTLVLMRLGVLPFLWLASLVVYFWARRDFGNPVAVIATALFTMLPPVLAHAGFATIDMGLTACLGAAFYALVLWAREPTYRRSLVLGVAAAAAALTRFTALGYLPAAAVFALLAYIGATRPSAGKLAALAKERAAMFLLAVVTGAFTIWAAYWFSFGKVPGWNVSLPAPEVFDGINYAMRHNQTGHDAYLLGQTSMKGWWYFFLVVLAVKTPLAFLLLSGLGIYLCWKKRTAPEYVLPLALSLGCLVPALTSHVNIGVRLILPVYIGLSIVAALAVVQLAQWGREWKWAGAMAGLLVFWMAFTGAAAHPDYLPYFNELARAEPDRILVDSDYDWGQDTKRLARRLRELGATEVSFGHSGATNAAVLQVFPGLPHIKPIQPLKPAEGWTAVSPTLNKTTQYGLYYRYPNLKPWWESQAPTEKVGTLLLYYLAPGSVRPAPPGAPVNTPRGAPVNTPRGAQ